MVAQLIGVLGTTVVIGVGLKTVEGIDMQSKKLLQTLKPGFKFDSLAQAKRVTKI